MEPKTADPTGHLSLSEARARLAERIAALARNKIAGRVRDEDYAEIDRSLAECTKQADDTQKEIDRARTSVLDAQGLLAFLREAAP